MVLYFLLIYILSSMEEERIICRCSEITRSAICNSSNQLFSCIHLFIYFAVMAPMMCPRCFQWCMYCHVFMKCHRSHGSPITSQFSSTLCTHPFPLHLHVDLSLFVSDEHCCLCCFLFSKVRDLITTSCL